MRRFAFAVLILAALCQVARAGIIVEGISYTNLAPTLPFGTNDSVAAAFDNQHRLWMSDGRTLYREDGGAWVETIGLTRSQGGVIIDTNVTTSFAWGSDGRLYFNQPNSILYRDLNGVQGGFVAVTGFVRQMRFADDGKLIVLTETGDAGSPGSAWEIDVDTATAELIGSLPNGAESFDFDINGDLLVPHYHGTGIDRLTRAGVTSTLFSYTGGVASEWQSIAVTEGGNLIVGLATGYDDVLERNTSRLIRINGVTGEQEIIGYDIDLSQPASLDVDGGILYYSGYGSTHAVGINGNLDGPLVPLVSTPEPNTAVLALVATIAALVYRKARRPAV